MGMCRRALRFTRYLTQHPLCQERLKSVSPEGICDQAPIRQALVTLGPSPNPIVLMASTQCSSTMRISTVVVTVAAAGCYRRRMTFVGSLEINTLAHSSSPRSLLFQPPTSDGLTITTLAIAAPSPSLMFPSTSLPAIPPIIRSTCVATSASSRRRISGFEGDLHRLQEGEPRVPHVRVVLPHERQRRRPNEPLFWHNFRCGSRFRSVSDWGGGTGSCSLLVVRLRKMRTTRILLLGYSAYRGIKRGSTMQCLSPRLDPHFESHGPSRMSI